MDFINQVKMQLAKMSETEKDTWILCQAKLLSESRQEGFLLSLSDEKKVIDMPTPEEIEKFCERVECGDIYFEYETHYYEFDDDGRYMDDWKIWHNDVFRAIPFLDRVFEGCHDLLRLEEYQAVSDILSMICELRFSVREAKDSEDSPEDELFSLLDANKESMFVRGLSDVGADWIRAVVQLTKGQDDRVRAQKLIEMFDNTICQNVKPRILVGEDISQKIFAAMAEILERKITDLESFIEKTFPPKVFSHEKYKMRITIDKKKKILLDIRVKCLKTLSNDTEWEGGKLAACWKQIQEGIKWLSYEHYIDNQPEIDEIFDICEALIRNGQLEKENWSIRKNVLRDIIYNEYYGYYNCGDVMSELVGRLCTNKEEHLACADIMDESGKYKEKAAYLYYEYGREDKYVSYLESHLERRSKEYSALITYYQEHNQQENARRVAELGLEKCREDLTDIFICLLLDAQKECDQKRFQKLYASAKRRKHVDMEKVKDAVGELSMSY